VDGIWWDITPWPVRWHISLQRATDFVASSDACVLAGIYLVLVGLCLVGLWKDARPLSYLRRWPRKPGLHIQMEAIRGELSRENFHLAYGLVSVLLLQVINVAEAGKGYKVLISIAGIGMLLYLFYFNGWMRNNVVRFVTRWRQRPER
jgi:hypothetical protein